VCKQKPSELFITFTFTNPDLQFDQTYKRSSEMKARLILFIYVVTILSAVVLATKAIAQEKPAAPKPPPVVESNTIIETAQAAGTFNTLLKALDTAGLTDTLKGAGPYTLFAPTDEAFANLPPGTLEGWLKDKEQLKKVLLTHVISGKVTAKDAAKLKTAKSLSGAELTIQVVEDKLSINNAPVLQPDITASNGVIHAVNTVILPANIVPAND
jgi:uncharacterized surface protein with fasciclin (FAS1) repeats